MILKDKVSFDSSDCRVEIPKKYADKFSNIIFIPSTYFKYFNYCSVYNVNFPTIEDYMKSLGLSEKDYLVFGESLGYGWSDAGCNVLYAVATNIAFTRDECLNALDIMWRNWQFSHVKDGLIITSGNDMYIERTDAKSAFFKGYQYGCAYQGYIVLDKVSKDTYKCFKQGKEGVLTRDEIIQHVQCNNVLNAKGYISEDTYYILDELCKAKNSRVNIPDLKILLSERDVNKDIHDSVRPENVAKVLAMFSDDDY